MMQHSPQQRARWTMPLVLVALGMLVAAGTFALDHWRFRTYRSAWPLDLAFFNHQLWCLSHGMQPLTLQPGNFYASEGPEPWHMAQMRLLTFLLLPVYALAPGVTTLLVLQSAACGLGVWPMYHIAARGSGSAGWGVAAAAFYAVSPPVWLLGALDFRYLTLGVPLALAAYDALEARAGRRYVVTALAAMLIRQVFAVALAVLAVAHYAAAWLGCRMGLRDATPSIWRWLAGPVLLSAAWLVLDQGWLLVQYGPETVGKYWRGMHDPAAVTSRESEPVRKVLAYERSNLLRYGPGAIAGSVAAPELAAAAAALSYAPLRMGQWSVHPAQHFSRYATLSAVALLAAATVSFGRLGAFERRRRTIGAKRLARLIGGSMFCAAAVSGGLLVHDTLALPSAYSAQERNELLHVVSRIARGDGVMASHFPIHGIWGTDYPGAFSPLAPLSTRARIYDYNQLPVRRNRAGDLVPVTLSEALGDVRWCILSQPAMRLPPELDRTNEVRKAIAPSGEFERVANVGRVEVYRRRETP